MKGFYLGLLHPLSTPPQLLALLALGMLLGQIFPRNFVAYWIVFALSALCGMILVELKPFLGLADPVLLIIAVLSASLAAIFPAPFRVPSIVLSGGAGLLLGVASIPESGPLRAASFSIAGAIVGANLVLLYVTSLVGWLRNRFTRQWTRVALRIVAAWVAAISSLMLALNLSAYQ